MFALLSAPMGKITPTSCTRCVFDDGPRGVDVLTTTYYFFLFTVCKFAWRGQLAVCPIFSVQPMLACTQYYDYLLCLVFSRVGMMSASFLHGFWTYCSSDHMIAQKYAHMEQPFNHPRDVVQQARAPRQPRQAPQPLSLPGG